MKFLNKIYDAIISVFDFIVDLVSIELFSFLMIGIFIIVIFLGMVLLNTTEQARVLRKLKKANYLIENKRQGNPIKKKNPFIIQLDFILTKRNTRLRALWYRALTQKQKTVGEVMADPILYSAYNGNQNVIAPCGYFLALLCFVFALGAFRGKEAELLDTIFKAFVFPTIILAATFFFNVFYKFRKQEIHEDMIEQAKYFVDVLDKELEQEDLTAIRQKAAEEENKRYQKNKKKKIKKGQVSQPEVKQENAEELPAETENFVTAESEGVVETESIIAVKDEATAEVNVSAEPADELAANTEIIIHKQQLETELAEVKEISQTKQTELEEELKKTREELENIKKNLLTTDDDNTAELLRAQEDSQAKLIHALEKLKQSEQEQIREKELKAQREIAMLEESYRQRKQEAEARMQAELEEFNRNLEKQKKARIAQEQRLLGLQEVQRINLAKDAEKARKRAADEAEFARQMQARQIELEGSKVVAAKTVPSQRKDINATLTDLLEAMNKYQNKKK